MSLFIDSDKDNVTTEARRKEIATNMSQILKGQAPAWYIGELNDAERATMKLDLAARDLHSHRQRPSAN
jgi:hypothetical protein